MSDLILTIVFWMGVVFMVAFVIAGLVSPRVRRMLQRPADDMLRNDRARWGEGTSSDGDRP